MWWSVLLERGFSQAPMRSLAMATPAFGRTQPGDPWLHAGRVWAAGMVSCPAKGALGGVPFLLPDIALLPVSCQGSPEVLATQPGEVGCGRWEPPAASACPSPHHHGKLKWEMMDRRYVQNPATLFHSHHLLRARSHENEIDKKQFLMGYISVRQSYLAEEEAPNARWYSG